jgi:hypothetical protein
MTVRKVLKSNKTHDNVRKVLKSNKTHDNVRKVPKSNKTKIITMSEKFQSPIKQNT